MTRSDYKPYLTDLFLSADVQINGSRPWDIHVHDERFYARVVNEHTIGLGESYMDGWWDCDRLDELFYKILHGRLQDKVKINLAMVLYHLRHRLTNVQSKFRLRRDIAVSYERGVDLYTSFLDPYNQYSCAYFKETDDLATAQRQKMDLICRKLYLNKGDKVLDIGSGWGGLSRFMAENCGVSVTGINISGQQIDFSREFCNGADVEILEMDYRELLEPKFRARFDKVVSVGMIEHVGYRNHRQYMQAAANCMKDDGIFLLHSIGSNDSITSSDSNMWLTKYIFPDSMPPSMEQITSSSEHLFIIEDVHNFGEYYDLTLMEWARSFEENWSRLSGKYDERFHRMWRYYLLQCAGGFRAGFNQLWQIVMRKHGREGMYVSVR